MTPAPIRASALFLLLLAGCGSPQAGSLDPTDPPGRTEQAVDRGVRYLLSRQDADGSWRSDLYGPLKDGLSLTPLVLDALNRVPASKAIDAARRKGCDFLAGAVQPDGTIEAGPHALTYPVYTSALAVVVLGRSDEPAHRKARAAWLNYLRERQLTEEMGWQPEDKQYGGWGFCSVLPRKPKPGEGGPPLLESNLSATVFALEALHAAGVPADDPTWRKARVFVERCQNFADDTAMREPAFDDGGFFFIYDDPVRNKAGLAGKDRNGRDRFSSYGSITADGLRALQLCHAASDHPRVIAARRWLENNFRADTHPGHYSPAREAEREAVYYYYARSLARTLTALASGPLVEALIERQQPDGSWTNSAIAQRENDPLVATAYAVAALTLCGSSVRQ